MKANERRYDFKKELLTLYKENRRDYSLSKRQDEYEIKNGIALILPEEESRVVYTAARDLCDYLYISMGVSAMIMKHGTPFKGDAIRLSISDDIGECSGYMGYRINTSDGGILLEGYDERGIAQGIYFLEDLMSIRKAPFIKNGCVARRALFEARITQSPLGFMQYDEAVLSLIAHLGFDSIIVWIRNSEMTLNGPIDLTVICENAEKYGLDVYAQLYVSHEPNETPEAFYDKIYGELFTACPKIKGISIVGEAAQFGSRDPLVGRAPHSENYVQNIPTGKPTPGWWPCSDLPDMLRLIRDAVRKYKPDAIITLTTYNWGYAPEEYRIRLLENIPKDIVVNAVWDVFEKIDKNGTIEMTRDYTLSIPGPGNTFLTEARAAKRLGLKLSATSNTAGLTWDFGTIPYEPMPYQWIKRFRAILKAREDYGLSRLLESIHYGFYPSIITELAKQAFFTEIKPLEDWLRELLIRDFGEDNLEPTDRAMRLFSEAITHYNATNEEQYGAFRIGPAYPLWSMNDLKNEGRYPASPRAVFGNRTYNGTYHANYARDCSLPGMRMAGELADLERMKELMLGGIEALERIKAPNIHTEKLINLAKYMYRTVITAIHVKRHFIAKRKLDLAGTLRESEEVLSQMEEILLAERENVIATIPLVRADSRLGWEPSTEYQGDERALEWKLRQLRHELEVSMPLYKNKLKYGKDI